jgi:hypothetical protein
MFFYGGLKWLPLREISKKPGNWYQIRDRKVIELVMGKVLITKLPRSVYPWGQGSTDKDYRTGGAVDRDQPAANNKIGLFPSFKDKNEAIRAVTAEMVCP